MPINDYNRYDKCLIDNTKYGNIFEQIYVYFDQSTGFPKSQRMSWKVRD